ncbi:MAG: hypothetical protein RLZZ455_837 [Candidatus Parcubacteria bacterium]|jgi:hypothetical protein
MKIRKGVELPTPLYEHYASQPNEHLFLATRMHPYTLLLPGLFIVTLALMLSALSFLAALYGFIHSLHFFALLLAIWVTASLLFAGHVLLWRSHYYIVTSRKMIEIRGFPLLFYTINDILLDQVRCTEIDIKTEGILDTLLNMGDITLTFDRPTHQESFTIAHIHDPRRIGFFLGDKLEESKNHLSPLVWNKPTSEKHAVIYESQKLRPLFSTTSS